MVASTWKIFQEFWKRLDRAAVGQLLLSNHCQILKGSYSQKVEANLIRTRRLPRTFCCLYLNGTMSSNRISMKETRTHPLAVNSWHCPLPRLSKELLKATVIWRKNTCRNLRWQPSALYLERHKGEKLRSSTPLACLTSTPPKQQESENLFLIWEISFTSLFAGACNGQAQDHSLSDTETEDDSGSQADSSIE